MLKYDMIRLGDKMTGKTYVISDLHGHFDLLIKLLETISFSENDILYIIGDICDRGPDSLKILFYIQYRLYICAVNNKNKDMKMDFKLRWVQLIALFCLIGMYSGSLDDECKNRKEKINLYIGFETVDLS